MTTGVVTEIQNVSLNINTNTETCAWCREYVLPCGGIADCTNLGWKCWHNECYEDHRRYLGMGRRFPKEPKFKAEEPRGGHHTYTRQYADDFDFDDPTFGYTESEFFGGENS